MKNSVNILVKNFTVHLPSLFKLRRAAQFKVKKNDKAFSCQLE